MTARLPSAPTSRPWKGPWLLAVAALHTAYAAAAFPEPLAALWRDGLVDSVGSDPLRGAVTWFVLFGAVLALLGLGVLQLERTRTTVPRTLGVGLLALALLGIALMPASGFWLALPPALALLRHGPPQVSGTTETR